MEYNTDKTALRLREYGRNVQHMANYAKDLSDNEEKKKWAELIVQVMSQLNPSVRSMEDYKTKLWQHIGIISEGSLVEFAPEGSVLRKKRKKRPRQIQWFTPQQMPRKDTMEAILCSLSKRFLPWRKGRKRKRVN